jgi:hypothetical protein
MAAPPGSVRPPAQNTTFMYRGITVEYDEGRQRYREGGRWHSTADGARRAIDVLFDGVPDADQHPIRVLRGGLPGVGRRH